MSLPSLFALCMLLLGCAVVCWGLHDKLSLYAPPGASVPSAQAKLLSERERPSAQVTVAAPQPPAPMPVVSFLMFAALLHMLFAFQMQSLLMSKPRFRQPKTLLFDEALYRRPPPVGIRICRVAPRF